MAPGLVSATPWNHAGFNHSTSFETASETTPPLNGQNENSGGPASGVFFCGSSVHAAVSRATGLELCGILGDEVDQAAW